MRNQSAARLESGPTCPSCGRPATGLKTGQCIYCLAPIPEFASAVDPARILRLNEFERARGQVRGRGSGKWVKGLLTVMAGVLLGVGVIGMFGVAMKWLKGLFSMPQG